MAYTRLGAINPFALPGVPDPFANIPNAPGAPKPTTNKLTSTLTNTRLVQLNTKVPQVTRNTLQIGDATGSVLLVGGIAVLVIGGVVAAIKKLNKKTA